MRLAFILSAFVSALLLGCAGQPMYEPSQFAQDFDPGKVVESMAGILWNDGKKAHNKSFGMQETFTAKSYFRVFRFEPLGMTNTPLELVSELKGTVTRQLQEDGFEVKLRDNQVDDFSLSYRSTSQSGSIHIFSAKNHHDGAKIIGVIHETPNDR